MFITDKQKDQKLPRKVNQKTWYYTAYNHQYRITENNRKLLFSLSRKLRG